MSSGGKKAKAKRAFPAGNGLLMAGFPFERHSNLFDVTAGQPKLLVRFEVCVCSLICGLSLRTVRATRPSALLISCRTRPATGSLGYLPDEGREGLDARLNILQPDSPETQQQLVSP